MGLFDFLQTKKEPAGPKTLPADHGLHKEDYSVVGMTYHQEEIARIQVANPQWRKSKKTILEEHPEGAAIDHYSYVEKPVKLFYDREGYGGASGIMVLIAGEHVGYISTEDAEHVKEILDYGSIKYMTAKISGGDYRIVFKDGTEQKGRDPLKIKLRIAYAV